jgi:hypothetical protein
VQAQEPRALPWRIQIVVIIATLVLLAIFLGVITSELRSAPPASSSILPVIHHLTVLANIPI